MVRGIVFCGTPHRGSDFANAAEFLGRYFGGSQPHVREMRKNAYPLDMLHDKFIAWQSKQRVPVASYAESKRLFRKWWPVPWFRSRLVVPHASANPGIARQIFHD